MKTRRLTPDEHKARLSMGVCPRCGDYRIVRVMRVGRDDDGRGPRFLGAFYACGGPKSHECYHLSGESGSSLAESADGTEPVRLPKPEPGGTRVIRRRKQ